MLLAAQRWADNCLDFLSCLEVWLAVKPRTLRREKRCNRVKRKNIESDLDASKKPKGGGLEPWALFTPRPKPGNHPKLLNPLNSRRKQGIDSLNTLRG